ncbi:MAG: hypothetical protein ABSG05_00335 [Candidatus Pacearchaeota archaeon]|jgi:uncharacterized membrane protein
MRDDTLIWIIIGAVLVIAIFSGLWNGFFGYSGMMGMMYGAYGFPMMIFGWIYGILIVVALALLVLWLAKKIQEK